MKQGNCIEIETSNFALGIIGFVLTACLVSLLLYRNADVAQKENLKLKTQMALMIDRLEGLDESLTKINQYSAELDSMTGSQVDEELEGDQKNFASMTLGAKSAQNPLSRINELIINTNLLAHRMETLTSSIEDRESIMTGIPSLVPAAGRQTSRYGHRKSPFTGRRTMHRGVDIAAAAGSDVVAPGDGKVIYAGRSKAFGKIVILRHGFGIVTKFAHNSKLKVRKGQKVKRGEVIALVGSTGRSTGAHLHYEVWVNGKPANPKRFLLEANNKPLVAALDVKDFINDTQRAMGGEEVDSTEFSTGGVVLRGTKIPAWSDTLNLTILGIYGLLAGIVVYFVRRRKATLLVNPK